MKKAAITKESLTQFFDVNVIPRWHPRLRQFNNRILNDSKQGKYGHITNADVAACA